MGIWQNSFTRVIFQYKTYNFPSFQTCSFIGVLTLFDTKYLTDRQTNKQMFYLFIDATLASIQGIDFLHGMMGFPWDNLGQDLG